MICKKICKRLVQSWRFVLPLVLCFTIIFTILIQNRSKQLFKKIGIEGGPILAPPVFRVFNSGVIKPVSVEEYEKYFVPAKIKITPFTYDFSINGFNICGETARPYLVIIVPSVHKNKKTRDAIRNSWGSLARGKVWPNKPVNDGVKLVFLFGKVNSAKLETMLREENNEHNDIIQGDFIDSYNNLTLKVLLGLRWVSLYCNDADFILKADEDTFVNVPKLIEFLKKESIGLNGKILGNLNSHSKVRRKGKWVVDVTVYPFSHYPTYASGNTYVLSTNIASRIFRVAEYMRYVPIEDAYITGILAKVINAEHLSIPGFTFWFDRPPKTCDFVLDKKITATNLSPQLMMYIWGQLHSKGLICTQ